ncbi:hypothetical protein LZ30DRAFT_697443 [Colletotrichum cereale]|nr:hypothetical protein LZ30DRAFT_697443 [Colletotrichum cereale]
MGQHLGRLPVVMVVGGDGSRFGFGMRWLGVVSRFMIPLLQRQLHGQAPQRVCWYFSAERVRESNRSSDWNVDSSNVSSGRTVNDENAQLRSSFRDSYIAGQFRLTVFAVATCSGSGSVVFFPSSSLFFCSVRESTGIVCTRYVAVGSARSGDTMQQAMQIRDVRQGWRRQRGSRKGCV